MDVMVVEFACAARAYLDLTFTGLQALPRPGEEEFATDLIRSPGGGALNVIGAARLDLQTAAAFPLGDDEAGRFLRAELERDGILVAAAPAARTAISAVMPYGGDRAMVTYDPEIGVDADVLMALRPERVLCTIDQVSLIPVGARAFVTVGDREVRLQGGHNLPTLPPGTSLLVNAVEARTMTERDDVFAAAAALAEWAEVVVITLGADGALARSQDVTATLPGVDVDAVDTTGAGDLFAAAWVWGDARGLDMDARLSWAVLYAGLSVRVPSGAAGALHLEQLIEAGARRGLRPPVAATPVPEAL
jgi:sugar/nucleoside kinase (ribokinase family)